MPGVLDKASGDLPPTATYAVRYWDWFPGDHSDPSQRDGRDGTVVVTLQRVRRRGRRVPVVERATYGVQEDAERSRPGHRVFLFLKDDDVGEPYQVVLADWFADCTCTATNCRSPHCRHRDVLRELAANELV